MWPDPPCRWCIAAVVALVRAQRADFRRQTRVDRRPAGAAHSHDRPLTRQLAKCQSRHFSTIPMPKRSIDDDDGARKCQATEYNVLSLPAELIEMIALAGGPTEYRSVAATCRRTRQLLMSKPSQERAKQAFVQPVSIPCSDGRSMTTKRLPNGDNHGTSETRDSTGKLESRQQFHDGWLHGLSERWYADGTLKEVTSYCRGKIHGKRETWHPNGVRSELSYYRHGEWTCQRKEWDANGMLIRETPQPSQNHIPSAFDGFLRKRSIPKTNHN